VNAARLLNIRCTVASCQLDRAISIWQAQRQSDDRRKAPRQYYFHNLNPDNLEQICSLANHRNEHSSQPMAIADLLKLQAPDSEVHALHLIKSAHSWGHFGIRSTKKRLSLLQGWDMSGY
jgi:hypothetical protein